MRQETMNPSLWELKMTARRKYSNEQRLARENALLKREKLELLRKIDQLEFDLSTHRQTVQALARRASYGTGYQQ